MPKPRDRTRLGNRTVLQVAMDVHSTAMGSYDRDQEAQQNDIKLLTHILETWDDSILKAKRFDEAVRKILLIAMEEAGICTK